MKMFILVFLWLVSPNISLAETAEHLLIPANTIVHEFAAKESVPLDLIATDIRDLIYALRSGYGGYSVLKTQIETETIPALESLQMNGSSTVEICRTIGKILDRIPDNHISVRFYGSNERCGKSPARAARVGSNIQSDKTLPWGVSNLSIGEKTVPVISMTTMMLSTSTTWNGFLDQVREIYKSAPALIIDLRGNPGGDDTKARQMANILAGNADENSDRGPAARLVMSQTPESMALFTNFFLYMLKVGNADGSPADPSYQGYYDQFMEKYRAAVAGSLPATSEFHREPSPLDKTKVFKGPIRILIDADCASSCESAVTFFEGFQNVKTVGENSGGFFHFGNVGKLWMKNSNVFVHLPIQSWLYDDGRFIEKIGISPDLRVSMDSDALDAAKADVALDLLAQ